MSYNVRSLRDDTDALTATLREAAPDLVCVQEAPRFLRWRSKCAELARRSNLFVVTGGRTAGDALLLASLRVDVREAHTHLMAHKPRLHRRGVAYARVVVAGQELVVASLHLGLDAEQRLEHAQEVIDRLSSYSLPVVLGSDVNESPGEPAWDLLAARWPAAPAEGLTFPSTASRRRIDAVFTDLPVVTAAVLGGELVERASDHRPVVADLQALPR
jgi:endonuclease/exonuclease/phosphatase family metal-dependent hydrolase